MSGGTEKARQSKTGKVKPTIRMQRLAKALAENRGKSFRKAAIEVGYSQSVADSPDKVTKSASWKSLMNKYLPEELIAQKHQELLNAEEIVFIPRGSKILERKRPDFTARKAGVEMGYKLRGSYAAEKVEIERRKFQDMTDEELAVAIAEAKKVLFKK